MIWDCPAAVSYTHLIMIHQPSGGAKGQATEIQIAAENILKTKKRLNEILAANTGKPYETIAADTERDNYMSAQEAADYGLIDGAVSYTHLADNMNEKLIPIGGTPINLLQMPEGCAFCPRCESAMKICLKQQPAEFRVGEDHLASCWMNVKEIYEAQEGGSNEQ